MLHFSYWHDSYLRFDSDRLSSGNRAFPDAHSGRYDVSNDTHTSTTHSGNLPVAGTARNFVPSPYKMGVQIRHIRFFPPAIIIKLHEIWQMLAFPSARGNTPFALFIKSIQMIHSKFSFIGFRRNFLDAKRERIEVEQAHPIPYHSSIRSMGIQQHPVTAAHTHVF